MARRNETWETQSVLLSRDVFGTQREADRWIRTHEDSSTGKPYRLRFRNKKPDKTDDFWRYRQRDPGRYKTFGTLTISEGVKLVRGKR